MRLPASQRMMLECAYQDAGSIRAHEALRNPSIINAAWDREALVARLEGASNAA